MRTTNKVFKEQIQGHILSGLLDSEELKSGYGIEVDENNLTKQQLEIVNNEFKNWYSPYEQKRTPNKQEAFKEFLQGLPSCINTEYTHYGIHETMKSWFTNADQQYKHNEPNEKEQDLYYNLIFRETNNLMRKNGLNGFNW